MKISLRSRLVFGYSVIVIISLLAFGTYMYFSVSEELYSNLDASLIKVAKSLDHIIEQNYEEVLKLKNNKQDKALEQKNTDVFSVFTENKKRRFVGPLRPNHTADTVEKDVVWNAIFEHILLDSKNYYIQIADTNHNIIWRSQNLRSDSLPFICEPQKPEIYSIDSTCAKKYFNEKSKNLKITKSGYKSFVNLMLCEQKTRLLVIHTKNAVISVGYTVQDIRIILNELFSALILALPLILLVSITGGLLLSKFSLKPVDEITRTANDITATNLSLRLKEPGINDEIGRLTKTLNRMINRLENSFNQIGQFTSNASHELRTPLTILRGELELALREHQTNDDCQLVIASSLDEVIRLSNVVDTLLELSRADTGQIKLSLEYNNLSKLLSEIVEDTEILAESKNISVNSNIEKDLLVPIDSGRIHQAILNIIDNAIKYTPADGKIDINLYKKNSFYEINVSDNGIGISEQDLPFIFDRFYRIDKTRFKNIQGTGLGLSIVKWIIDLHKGNIIVKSQEGIGTQFVIQLPYNEG